MSGDINDDRSSGLLHEVQIVLDEIMDAGVLKANRIKHSGCALCDSYAWIAVPGLYRKSLGRDAAKDREIIILRKFAAEITCAGCKDYRALEVN